LAQVSLLTSACQSRRKRSKSEGAAGAQVDGQQLEPAIDGAVGCVGDQPWVEVVGVGGA